MSIDNAAASSEEIARGVSQYDWYHRIDLGHGIITPGEYDLEPLLPHYGIPDSLEGKDVLDIGPGHGFFSFEFERRGAARVATAELPHWADHDASPALRDWFQEVGDSPDKYPYHRGALDFAIRRDFVGAAGELFAIRRVCRDQAIICTGIDASPAQDQPTALFVGTASGQAFWLPTMGCLEHMLLAAGFSRAERVSTFSLRSMDGKFDTPHGTLRAYVV